MKPKKVYRVINPKAGTDTFKTKEKAMTRARARAKRECGEVAVEVAHEYPGSGVVTYNQPGSGIIWRSEWRSCPTRRRGHR